MYVYMYRFGGTSTHAYTVLYVSSISTCVCVIYGHAG